MTKILEQTEVFNCKDRQSKDTITKSRNSTKTSYTFKPKTSVGLQHNMFIGNEHGVGFFQVHAIVYLHVLIDSLKEKGSH